MNAVVEIPNSALMTAHRLSAAETVDHVRAIQEIMRSVMKEGVHFGVVPGTKKPTLLKPGADVLCVAFRIAVTESEQDLSTRDRIRFRITSTGTHAPTGIVLGSSLGECSSDEEKYRWRKAVSMHEYHDAPEDRRRVKHGYDYTVHQVRTEPADVANTILKMAAKRAKVAMVLNVTGASDMFSQDLEDLDAELRSHLTGSDEGQPKPASRQRSGQDVSDAGPAVEALRADGNTAASKGMKALTAWWSKLDAKQQKAMSKDFGGMRRVARAADEGGSR